MTTLEEFLLARIADDEKSINQLTERLAPVGSELLEQFGDFGDDERWMIEISAGRLRDECQAKRRIVEEVERVRSMIPAHVIGDGDEHDAVIADWMDATVLRFMASVYADHPGYDPAWAL